MYLIITLILSALVIAYLFSRKGKSIESDIQLPDKPADCCGAHEVCESDSLLSSTNTIDYYDDEELDRFKGTPGNCYQDEEIDQFREILYSLKEREVAGWLKSLQLRGIIIPDIVKEEALLIVSERRQGESH